jgi:hypothetical protein
MKIRDAVAGLGILVCLTTSTAAMAQPASSSSRIDSENRLLLRFVEDAAIVPSFWFEGQARLDVNTPAFDSKRGAGESDLLVVGPVFAFNVAEDYEFGGRLGVAFRDPDPGGSDTGLNDMDIWGKLSVVSDPVEVALGILVQLPTGDEEKFLGTGETTVEFFAAARKNFSGMSLAGNLGVRVNQDADFDGIELEGRNSLMAGAALLFPLGQRLVFSLEWALETERFDGLKNDSRLLGGLDYALNDSLVVRGGLVAGLSDGAPDAGAIGSVVWLF